MIFQRLTPSRNFLSLSNRRLRVTSTRSPLWLCRFN